MTQISGDDDSVQICLKDPDAKLDYSVDWTLWLRDGETIQSAEWFVPAGLVHVASEDEKTDTRATAWLAGGEVGVTFRRACAA